MARYSVMWALMEALGMVLVLSACGGGGKGAAVSPTGAVTSPAVRETTAPTLVPATPSVTSTAAAGTSTTTPGTPVPSPTPSPAVGTLGGAQLLGLDMNPFAAPANSCPGTGSEDCTLGTIEECISVPNVPGQTFTVDVFIQGLPRGFQAWSSNLEFPDTASAANLTLISRTTTLPSMNLVVQSAGSEPVEISEDVPDLGTPHHAGVGEFGTSEDTPPFTQGVLGRYEFAVGEGAAAGVYSLTLDPNFVDILDKNGNGYVIDQLGSGLVALGQDCP